MIFFDSQINDRQLAMLCRRSNHALRAGLDVRDHWAREAENALGKMKNALQTIANVVAGGGQLIDGFERCGEYFPPLVRQLVRVGEETGQLPEIFRRLADHYESRQRAFKAFTSAIIWPMMQLSGAIFLFAILIWVAGAFGVDVLGWGLKGTSGLLIYFSIVGGFVAAVFFGYRAIRRGKLWIAPVERTALNLPIVGKSLQKLLLARMAWTLNITTDTSMSIMDAVELGVNSTESRYYTNHIQGMLKSLRAGKSLTDAFRQAGVFPDEFTSALETAEISGRLPEGLANLSEIYEEEAQGAVVLLAKILGYVVYGAVSLFLVVMIFVQALKYIGTIHELSQP